MCSVDISCAPDATFQRGLKILFLRRLKVQVGKGSGPAIARGTAWPSSQQCGQCSGDLCPKGGPVRDRKPPDLLLVLPVQIFNDLWIDARGLWENIDYLREFS